MKHTVWRHHPVKNSPEEAAGTFPPSGKLDVIGARVRGMRARLTSVAISVCALGVISVVKLITLFWRQREAPEIHLRDVEEKE